MVTASLPTDAELREHFPTVSDDALAICFSICVTYQLSAEDLLVKWESFAMRNDAELEPTVAALEQFRLTLLTELNDKIKQHTSGHGTTAQPGKQKTAMAARPPPPQQPQHVYEKPAPSIHAAKFEERANKLKVEESFNAHLARAEQPAPVKQRCTIGLAPDQQVEPFRYMFDKILQKSEFLDEQLEVYEGWFREAYPDLDEFSRPDLPSHAPICVVGRVVLAEADGGSTAAAKLSSDNLALEVGRKMNGARVKMRITPEVSQFALFPGQIVAVEGQNPTGQILQVSKMYKLPLLETPTTPISTMLRYHHLEAQEDEGSQLAFRGQEGQPLLVVSAAGPFTLSDSLGYQPYTELLAHMRVLQPDVLILTGPFVDDRHPLIQRGEVEYTPDELFRMCIMDPLLELVGNRAPHMQCILIPSLHDLSCPYLTFPQPPLLDRSWRDAWRTHPHARALPNIHFFPNPVQFYINEMLFAVATNDVLMHLSSSEYASANASAQVDRLTRLSSHVLEQRSLYPLLPGVENEGSLEYSHLKQISLHASPDVVLIPSHLRHMVKRCQGTLFVNSSFSARGQAGGCFAKLLIHPADRQALESVLQNQMSVESEGAEEARLDHQVPERTCVEIVRV
ncbi:DNA-directed DNA polymerase alpha subunit pol12 [Sorochytrium milnesiophthora]